LLLVRNDSDSPQNRVIRSVHETFARNLAGALSTFLQAEIGVALDSVSFTTAGDYRRTVEAPGCFVSFRLDPRPEQMILAFDPVSVFGLLELLLGGSGSTRAEARVLTEIEWGLLEEVVRILVRSLGESWKAFHSVEFHVLKLESDPDLLPFPDAVLPMVQLAFALRFNELEGSFQIAVPRTLFEQERSNEGQPAAGDAENNLKLLGEAVVEVEVLLDGPTMVFQELANVHPGKVIGFDYPLKKPVRAVVNGSVSIPCVIVSAGGKRAFQVEELP